MTNLMLPNVEIKKKNCCGNEQDLLILSNRYFYNCFSKNDVAYVDSIYIISLIIISKIGGLSISCNNLPYN